MLRLILLLVGGFFLTVTSAARAQAWELCNETSFILRVATVGGTEDALAFQGWERLRPGQCFTSDLSQSATRYVFAESSTAYQGGIREWAGSRNLCAGEVTALSRDMCNQEGLLDKRFFQIATSETRTAFVEPDDFGERAETAGLQRLLRDNGFRITAIDGYSGSQTRNALASFLKDNQINLGSSVPEKIDALEAGARAYQTNVGLTVCNESGAEVWAAIGFRSDGTWASQGWWKLDPNVCLRPVTKNLRGQDMHLYAVRETEDESWDIQTEDAEFCISELRFSALGRENCEALGYDSATFRNLESTDEGMKVTLKPSDFGLENGPELRR